MKRNHALAWLSKILLPALCISFLIHDSSHAQQSWLADEQYVSTFDVMTFDSGDSSRTFVEVYCHISTKWLQFVRTDSGFVATYTATLNIADERGLPLESRAFSDTLSVRTFWDIDAVRPAAGIRFARLLAPGSYDFALTLADPETSQKFILKRKRQIQQYSSRAAAISTPVLAKSICRTQATGPMVKFGHEVYPNIARVIGQETDSLFVYAEVYNPDKLTTPSQQSGAQIAIVMVDRRGRIVRRRLRRLPTMQAACNIVACLDTRALAPGMYEIKVALVAPDGSTQVQKSMPFLVLGPDLSHDDYAELLSTGFGKAAFN